MAGPSELLVTKHWTTGNDKRVLLFAKKRHGMCSSGKGIKFKENYEIN